MPDHPGHSRRPRAVEYFSKSAKREMDDLPNNVRENFFAALHRIATGRTEGLGSPMHGALKGVFELKDDDANGTYRSLFTIIVADKLIILGAFQKKSTHGIKTPERIIDTMSTRLKKVKAYYA